MVVEDEPDIYEVLLAMFEMWGIDGVAFVDGEEAVAWIEDVDNGRFRGELPELALLDIRLPGNISGPMVAKRLRSSSILGEVAIVLNTAYKLNVEEAAKVMAEADADELMYKPLPKFNELQQRLETVIAQRHKKAAEKEKAVVAEAAPAPKTSSNSKSSSSKTTRAKKRTRASTRRKSISTQKKRSGKA